ncbi:MAG: hypothetical protein ACOYLI_00535 [Synechococcus lacustris]
MTDDWLPTADQPEAQAELCQQICRAADLSRPGLKHAALPMEQEPRSWSLRLEVRDGQGQRLQREDLELELYGSAVDPSLQLGWLYQQEQPLLWQGRHPVWMDASSGARCERPEGGMALETLARRLRAQLVGG